MLSTVSVNGDFGNRSQSVTSVLVHFCSLHRTPRGRSGGQFGEGKLGKGREDGEKLVIAGLLIHPVTCRFGD